MPKISCYNTVNIFNPLKDDAKIRPCNRFLIQLPQCAIDSLKSNSGQKVIVRCPACKEEQRWVEVYYDKESGFVWRITDRPKGFDKEMKFDTIIKSEQIG